MDSQLATRLTSAGVMLAVAVFVTLWAGYSERGYVVTVVTTGVISGVCAFEMARLFARDSRTLRYQPVRGALIFLALLLPQLGAAWSALSPYSILPRPIFEPFTAMLGLGIAMLCSIVCYAGRTDIEEASLLGRGLGIGTVYLVGGTSAFIAISGLPGSLGFVWWLIGVVALGDTAAYFVGKRFGGPKIAPALSPNKTVSGSTGGLIASGITGALFWNSFVDPFATPAWGLLVGLLVGSAGQVGDLTKSYLKRLRGVKDFGAIIPGHGGVLDRCDGFLGGAMVLLPAILALVTLSR